MNSLLDKVAWLEGDVNVLKHKCNILEEKCEVLTSTVVKFLEDITINNWGNKMSMTDVYNRLNGIESHQEGTKTKLDDMAKDQNHENNSLNEIQAVAQRIKNGANVNAIADELLRDQKQDLIKNLVSPPPLSICQFEKKLTFGSGESFSHRQ